ncbi:MAG: tetratricopeptide repeat protein [Armatimonadota bacterium]
MEDRYALIKDLFDLPGAEDDDEALDAEREVQVGLNAPQSRDMAELSMKKGEFAEAIEHFKRAMAQGRNGPDALEDLGAAFEGADMLPQAYLQYKKALAKRDSGELHMGLSALFRRYGRFGEAISELRKAAENDPNDAYLHFRLAEALRANGHRRNALEAINHAITNAAEDPFYHYWQADLMVEMGLFEEAVQAARAAVELNPADEHVMLLAALALWGSKKQAEAIRAARLATELVTNDNHIPTIILWQFLRASGHKFEADALLPSVNTADRYDHESAEQMLKKVQLETEQ